MEPNDLTVLTITGPGIAPYSARGLTQSYEPISASIHLERDVDGGMIDFSAPQFRKYRSKISCTDQNTPALNGIWPGTVLTMECAQEMSFKSDRPEDQEREAVEGSVRTEGGYTFYRPIMTVIFLGWSATGAEYTHDVAWSFDVEEA